MKNAEDLNNLGMYMLHIFVMHAVSFSVKRKLRYSGYQWRKCFVECVDQSCLNHFLCDYVYCI